MSRRSLDLSNLASPGAIPYSQLQEITWYEVRSTTYTAQERSRFNRSERIRPHCVVDTAAECRPVFRGAQCTLGTGTCCDAIARQQDRRDRAGEITGQCGRFTTKQIIDPLGTKGKIERAIGIAAKPTRRSVSS